MSNLRGERQAFRRQRDDDWQDQQMAIASGVGYVTKDFAVNDTDRNNTRRVDLGVNLEHHAPFLASSKDKNENSNTNNTNTNAGGERHRALVWPAKNPQGPLASAATKGSAALKEHRVKQTQKRAVRAQLEALGAADQQQASSSSISMATATVPGTATTSISNADQQQQQQQQQQKAASNAMADLELQATLHDRQGSDDDDAPAVTTTATAVTAASATSLADRADELRPKRETLPVFAVRDQFVQTVRENAVVVVKGETGSGKTTQLPTYLLEERFAGSLESGGGSGSGGIIGCTQPRRVAAIGVARRVAEEVGTSLGDLVGYAVRLEDVSSPRTRLKFMTDGVLLREAVLDPMLWRYSVVVLDEAHERSIDTDVLLGVMRRVLRQRRDFRLVVMSATMQVEKFADFFGGAPIFEVQGRTFPVREVWAPGPVDDYVRQAVLQVVRVHMQANNAAVAKVNRAAAAAAAAAAAKQDDAAATAEQHEKDAENEKEEEGEEEEEEGDILVFLTGEEDVKCVCELIREQIDHLEGEIERAEQLDLDVARQQQRSNKNNAFATDDADADSASSDDPRVLLSARRRAARKRLEIIPCFSSILVNKEQLDRVLNPAPDVADADLSGLRRGTRKCIVATNVAETSLTIDGVTAVIDSGLMKCKVFKPKLGAHPLLPFPIAAAQAVQRMGRAGRTRAGVCYRLYTESAFQNEMLAAPVPEIKRTSIDRVCLFIKAIGIHDVERFDFIDPPPTEIVHRSLYALWLLGALDDRGVLTEKGRRLAALPVEPALGVALLTARELRCLPECLHIAAMLSVDARALFAAPRDREEEALHAREAFTDPRSDHLTLMNLLKKFLAEHNETGAGGEYAARRWAEKLFLSVSVLKTAAGIRQQLDDQVRKLLGKSSTTTTQMQAQAQDSFADVHFPAGPAGTLDAVRFAIVSGFFPQCAQRKRIGEYVTVLTRVPAELTPASALGGTTAEFVVYNELAMTAERSFLATVTVAEPLWLERAARGLFFVRGGNQPGPVAPSATSATAGGGLLPTPQPQPQSQQQQSTLSETAALVASELQRVVEQQQQQQPSVTPQQHQQQHHQQQQQTTGDTAAAPATAPKKFVPRKMMRR